MEGVVNEKPVLIGDVNMDGDVSVADVTLLIDFLLNGSVSGAFDSKAADVDEDGDISVADVTRLIDRLLSGKKAIARQWDAMPAAGGIVIENPNGEPLDVYDFNGENVAVVSATGNTMVELPAGIYVVASDDTSRKVVVK